MNVVMRMHRCARAYSIPFHRANLSGASAACCPLQLLKRGLHPHSMHGLRSVSDCVRSPDVLQVQAARSNSSKQLMQALCSSAAPPLWARAASRCGVGARGTGCEKVRACAILAHVKVIIQLVARLEPHLSLIEAPIVAEEHLAATPDRLWGAATQLRAVGNVRLRRRNHRTAKTFRTHCSMRSGAIADSTNIIVAKSTPAAGTQGGNGGPEQKSHTLATQRPLLTISCCWLAREATGAHRGATHSGAPAE